MKIKSNKNPQHRSQANHKVSPESNSQNNNHQRYTQQVNLPSQLMLYRQLVQQLGLQSRDERIRFRMNFKQKYQKHLKMLEVNHSNMDRFRQSREKQVIEQHTKIQQKRSEIQLKQNEAKDRKIKLKKKNVEKTQFEHQKWKSVVEKNKNQYLRNIKNSMKLIKRWQNKLSSSLTKKNEILEKITQQTKQHNQYVNIVVERNRNIQILQAQYKILKLQQSLSLRQRTGKKKTQQSQHSYSRLNPQNLYRTPSKKQKRSQSKTQRVKTYGSEAKVSVKTPIKVSRHRVPISNSQFSMQKENDQSKSNISKSNSYGHIDLKYAIDMQNIEQSLCKNIEKEKRIAEARNVKSYLYQQRNKQNRQKQQLTKLKIMENLQKLKQQRMSKNKKLDEKFNESRVKGNTRNLSPKSSSKLMNYDSPNVSLPFIHNKNDISNYVIPEYASLNLKKNKVLPEIGYKAKITKNNKAQRKSGNDDFIYLTQTKQNSPRKEDELSSKYNKKIMQKLRSLSLIANIKQRQQSDRNNEIYQKINQSKNSAKAIKYNEGIGNDKFLVPKRKQ